MPHFPIVAAYDIHKHLHTWLQICEWLWFIHTHIPFVDFVATTVSIGKMWLFWCSLHKRDDQYSLKTLFSLPQFQCSTFLSSPVLHISAMKWAVYTFPRLTKVPKKLFKVSSLFNFVSFIQSTNAKIRAPHLNVLTTIFICVFVCEMTKCEKTWSEERGDDMKREQEIQVNM